MKSLDNDTTCGPEISSWDKKFMQLAEHVSGWSKDRSRQIGCVVVGSANEVRAMGYNGFPRGADDDKEERHERPEKYVWTVHAEENTILNAARCGITLTDCKLYVNWFPCPNCARGVIQSGINHVICTQPNFSDPQWGPAFTKSFDMLSECNVKISYYPKELMNKAY